MDNFKTFTGLTMQQALEKMGEPLHPSAYKAVGGATDLTDINPAFLTKVANDVFGMCGFGWFYYIPDNQTLDQEIKTSKSGREYTLYKARIDELRLYIRLRDPATGEEMLSDAILANGYSENEDLGYAMRGAITNALGAAFSKLNWQILVYMGKLTHKNAAAVWNKRNKQEETEAEAPPQAVDGEKVPDLDEQLKAALKVVVPSDAGSPLDGKTLGEALVDETFGIAVLKFLTGKHPNLKKDYFQGAQEVKDAAALVFNNLQKAGEIAKAAA